MYNRLDTCLCCPQKNYNDDECMIVMTDRIHVYFFNLSYKLQVAFCNFHRAGFSTTGADAGWSKSVE